MLAGAAVSRPEPDPLARFLGFDPASGYGLARSRPEEAPPPRVIVVAAPLPPAEVKAPAPPNLAGLGKLTLKEALAVNPSQVLLLACKAIFRGTRPNQNGELPSGGRFGQVKREVERALQAIAGDPEFVGEVRLSGWIVGKTEDRHK